MDGPTSVLGIDIAKDTLVLFDSASRQVCDCPNTAAGLTTLLDQHGWTPDRYVVGMESTGDYGLVATQLLLERGFTVKVLNPLVTRKYTRATVG